MSISKEASKKRCRLKIKFKQKRLKKNPKIQQNSSPVCFENSNEVRDEYKSE